MAKIDNENGWSQDESNWAFVPSFLSRCLELQFVHSFGTVQKSFRIRPVLAQDHPIWRMCGNGDIDDIKELFSRRESSPFSVTENGQKLLHVSLSL